MDVTLPDGQVVKGVPDGTSRFDLASKLKSKGMNVPDEWLTPRSVREVHQQDEARNPLTKLQNNVTRAVGGPALSMAASAAGSTVGALEGIVKGAGAGAASLVQGEGLSRARTAFVDEAAENIQHRQAQFAHTPDSDIERTATGLVQKPFEKLAHGADVAGEFTSRVTGSPAAGALVNTAIQAAPALIGKGVSAARGAIGRAGRGTAPPGGAPPGSPLAGAPPAAPAPELSASGAPRAPMSDLGAGESAAPVAPRGTPPQGPAGAPGAAQPSPATATPPPGPATAGGTPGGPKVGPSILPEQTARAQAYAERIGLDWAGLGAGTRAALENIAHDSGALDRLNPSQVKRQAFLEGQRIPVPATRSQLTLDTVDARREAIAARTSEGQRIRDVDIRANAAVQGNLEALRGRVGGLKGGLHEAVDADGNPAATPSIRRETPAPTQVGGAFQGALREKLKWSKKGYEALYKKAEATEPDAQAGLKPVTDLLNENPDIQHIGWVQSWMSKARGAKARSAGAAPEDIDLSQVSLKELNDLRKLAVKNQAAGGTAGHYAGEVKRAVDAAMQDVPEGAKAWKEAIGSFRRHQEEFSDQAAVKRLVGNKKGGDRATPLERTWNKVAKGSVEEIRQIKRSALTGGTPQLRAQGRAAWRQVRAETVNRILEDARQVVATDETERQILTAAALNRTIKNIPRENLEEIIGVKNTRELYGILRARKLTKGRTTESGTVPNILVMVEKALGHIPGVGGIARGAVSGVSKLHEWGKAGRDTDAALTTPLQQAGEQVARTPAGRARQRQQQYRDIESTGPTLGDLP